MNSIYSLWDVALVFVLGLIAARYLGIYMARVFMGRPTLLDGIFTPIERGIYRLIGTQSRRQMGWKEYAVALLSLNALALVFVMAMLMVQQHLPYNYFDAPNFSWDLAFHTSSAFVTNTDFQQYSGETQMSLLSSMFGLQMDFFLSAATGLAVLAAFIRGFIRHDGTIGNFWVDFTMSFTRVLLPISVIGALVFLAAGVPETLSQAIRIPLLGGGHETIATGPLASWVSIENLGTNGGGYLATNAGNPFQDPNAFTIDFTILLMMLIGFGSPFMFGEMTHRSKEVQPLLATILVIFLAALGLFFFFEIANPFLVGPGLHLTQNAGYTVGADTRFSLGENAMFQVTSIYSNVGDATMQLASLTPGAQMVLLWGMFLQCAPGGVGGGLGTLLINVILAIFVGGLMVGRTPEYLGKKIGGSSVKWSVITFLSHPFAILIPLAVGFILVDPQTHLNYIQTAGGGGPQGFTAVLYEFTSESANNGSGMGFPGGAGTGTCLVSLGVNCADTYATTFYNVAGGFVMLFGRFFPFIAMLAIGGSLARAPSIPQGPGTLKTQSATFTFYLIVFILVVTGLLFLPVLALGPFAAGLGFP